MGMTGSLQKAEETKVLVAERGLHIGGRLREMRQQRALTQKELSELADVNEITISELERNKRTASARSLRKLASALGVDVQDLTMRPTEPPPDEPGLTEENREHIEEIRQERKQLRDGDRENSHDTGDRAP